MKFFFDNNLAPKLARGLNQMVEPEHQVVHLKDGFPGDVEDVVWMRALAREPDLVIVTADVRISRNPHEVQAWREAGLTIFFLKPGWTNLAFWARSVLLFLRRCAKSSLISSFQNSSSLVLGGLSLTHAGCCTDE